MTTSSLELVVLKRNDHPMDVNGIACAITVKTETIWYFTFINAIKNCGARQRHSLYS